MKKGITNFSGLYGENNSIISPNFIQSEALETRSKLYDWEINEHLHTDLYQVFVIESGSGILVSENKKFEIENPCVLLIPNNTLHGFHFQPEIAGEVITFSDSFLENIFKNSPKILLELNQLKQLSLENNLEVFQQIKLMNNN